MTAFKPLSTGAGAIPSPDTAPAFVAYEAFSSAVAGASAPFVYSRIFTDLNGSVNDMDTWMTTLSQYDPAQWATCEF